MNRSRVGNMTIPHTDPHNAEEMMGEHFVGLETATRCFRTRMLPGLTRRFSDIPYGPDVLRECAHTELLFPDLGITICELCLMSRGNMFHPPLGEAPCTSELTHSLQEWCDGYHAAHLTEAHRWRLVPLVLIDSSDDSSLADRIRQANAVCPEHDNHGGVMTPRILIYAAVLWHLVHIHGGGA